MIRISTKIQPLVPFHQTKPLHKILSQSVHNFLSNVANRQEDRQTKNIWLKNN